MRERKYKISVLIDDIEIDLETQYGFYLLESDDNIIGGERREFETETYPEVNGVKVYSLSTRDSLEYNIKLCSDGNKNTVAKKIQEFEKQLYNGNNAKEITVYNDSKGISFVGMNKNIEIEDFHLQENSDIIIFIWTILIPSGEIMISDFSE